MNLEQNLPLMTRAELKSAMILLLEMYVKNQLDASIIIQKMNHWKSIGILYYVIIYNYFCTTNNHISSPCFLIPPASNQSTYLLIFLTVSSRKDLSIAHSFIGGFSFHMQGISDFQCLLYIYTRESFLKVQDVRYTCCVRFSLAKLQMLARYLQ